MFKKIISLFLMFNLLSVFLIGFVGNSLATPYTAGYVWDRYTEYSTSSNPNVDQMGNAAWSYEWFTGMDYTNTNQMTQVASWGPRWEHGPLNISGWDQNTNYNSSWNTGMETTLIRWTNPAGDGTSINVDGKLRMFWGGKNWDSTDWFPGWYASPVDVQMVIGYFDASDNMFNLLLDQVVSSQFESDVACANFGDCPNTYIPLDYNLTLDAGDSFFWTAITLGQVNAKNRWITLNDNRMNITLESVSKPVPEPATMLLFGTGLAGLIGSHVRRKKKA